MDKGAFLNTLLDELKEGVMVCGGSDAEIMLFNQAAAALFDQAPSTIEGSSLYSLCRQPPIEHAVSLLHYQQHELEDQGNFLPYIQFMNETITGRQKFLRCRLSLLPYNGSGTDSFVIIFEDASSWYKPDNLLFMKIEEFRAPMTNLRAAVDSLTEHPEMSPVMRSAFENVLVQESLNLKEAFDSLALSCTALMHSQSHLAKTDAALFFGYVASHLSSKNISFTPTTHRSIAINIDSYGLFLVLNFLADSILQDKKKTGLACRTHLGERFIYFDFIWTGEIIPTSVVENLQEENIESSIGMLTVSNVLHSMEGDIWSQALEDSQSTLRLALPIAGMGV